MWTQFFWSFKEIHSVIEHSCIAWMPIFVQLSANGHISRSFRGLNRFWPTQIFLPSTLEKNLQRQINLSKSLLYNIQSIFDMISKNFGEIQEWNLTSDTNDPDCMRKLSICKFQWHHSRQYRQLELDDFDYRSMH